MNIVVCVKYVPDAQADRTFNASDNTDRPRERRRPAVRARRVRRRGGPEDRRGRRGRGDRADRRPRRTPPTPSRRPCRWAPTRASTSTTTRSTAPTPSRPRWCSPRPSRRSATLDLVITGMASTDGTMGVVPAMLAERLGLPAGDVRLRADRRRARTVTIRRDGDAATQTIVATLPALVSVTDQINEPRYPSFKGIMAAKKKPVEQWALADLGVDASQVGLDAAWTKVESFTSPPAARAGRDRHRRGRRRQPSSPSSCPRRSSSDLPDQPAKENRTMAEVLVLVDHVDGKVRKTTPSC